MDNLSYGLNDSDNFDGTLLDGGGQNSVECEHKAQSSGGELHDDDV